jgi:hypothetical protein
MSQEDSYKVVHFFFPNQKLKPIVYKIRNASIYRYVDISMDISMEPKPKDHNGFMLRNYLIIDDHNLKTEIEEIIRLFKYRRASFAFFIQFVDI